MKNTVGLRIVLMVCIFLSLCCSIRYSFRSIVFASIDYDGVVVVARDLEAIADKPSLLLLTATTTNISPSSKTSIQEVMQHKQNHNNIKTSSSSSLHVPPPPGMILYNESVDFIHKLVTILGMDEWKKYLRMEKVKRFKKSSGKLFTQKVYEIAAEVLLTTTMATNDNNSIQPLDDTTLKPPIINAVNCSNPKYYRAFTGNLDPEGDKIIVDWTLVGWDHDFTEIRLAEYGDLIDRLILFDMDTTLKGLPKPIIMPQVLKERFNRLYTNKIDYQLILNFTKETFPDKGSVDNAAYKIQTKLRNRGRDYAIDLYNNHTSKERVFIIQNDGDEIMTRDTLMHVIKCELKEPDEILFAPAVSFKRNLAWVVQGQRMSIHVHKEQEKFKEMIPYNWLKGPAVHRLYRKQKESFFRQLYFRIDQSFKVPHLGLGSAVHISSPGFPLSSVVKSMSTNDDPTTLGEIDSEFLNKALKKNLTYLELRKIGFACKEVSNIIDVFNKTTFEFTMSNLPWVIKAMPERYPWLIYPNMNEKEHQVQKCICAKNWRETISQKPECLALQNSPWT